MMKWHNVYLVANLNYQQSPAGAWKTVTDREIYVEMGLFMVMRCNLLTSIIWRYNKRDFNEFVNACILLTVKPSTTFKGSRSLFKIFPVISNVNNRFLELYLPNRDISTDELETLWKGCLSNRTSLSRHPKFGIKT
jgi:hypothetical protein